MGTIMTSGLITKNSTLIIGGGGYIGSYLAQLLISSGKDVTVLGRSKSPRYNLPERANYISGDFSDQKLICKLLEEHQEVVHLAYATVPNTSFENPLADLLQNLPATVQLFKEIARRNLRLLLVSSGGTVYGEAFSTPIDETHPAKPISPYGVTKLTLENYAYLYAKTHGLQFVCIRPGNAYGVGQRPFIGQGFISTAIASSIKNRPIKMFGKNGTIRDYLYVEDMASGIALALEKGHISETYNLGSSVGRSNLDIIREITPLMAEINCTIDIEYLPERSFDVKANILDSSKLKKHTGWIQNTNFNDGLSITRDWLWSNRYEF
ncbi:NAD-dependent epimerase/dehydratase family protein [Pseudomonas protegens]|uniref:NAD-dependent epimerase/dehydratase family protein n=1 Tax=Pseudomonas protegens TaxID=380021 RepID=UPI0038504867